MKMRVLAVISSVTATVVLGHLFLLSLLLGVLASRYVAGNSAGERGRVGSIMIPFRRWQIHLHHWLYSLWLMGISLVTGTCFLSPHITCGFLGGLVFQGVYSYEDWHVVVVSRQQAGARRQPPQEETTAVSEHRKRAHTAGREATGPGSREKGPAPETRTQRRPVHCQSAPASRTSTEKRA